MMAIVSPEALVLAAVLVPFAGAFGSTIVSGSSLDSPARRTVTVASVPRANVGSAGGVTVSPLTVTRMSPGRMPAL